MKDAELTEVSKSLREIVWRFGSKGVNNECCEDLSMAEFLALEKVANTKDCPIHDVGLHLGFTKSGATRIVNRLNRKGYVQKIRSPNDGRICCVAATEQGTKVLHRASRSYSEKFEDLLNRMPAKLAKQTLEVLDAMAGVLTK